MTVQEYIDKINKRYIAGISKEHSYRGDLQTLLETLAPDVLVTNVEELPKDFGKSTHQHDPIIHFFETFLTEYDPALRKSRGVWYSALPENNCCTGWDWQADEGDW